jgi:predicted regulator of Ras-like GTPase activity (Roadblock/LC7/MglB family)
MAEDGLLAEMRALRDRVVGITDTALASRDGLIIRADTADVDADNLAALAAASLGLARRMAAEVGIGVLHDAVTRSSGGYVATYAVGTTALLVLVGDAGLDTARLYRESRATIERLELILTGADSGTSQAAAS